MIKRALPQPLAVADVLHVTIGLFEVRPEQEAPLI